METRSLLLAAQFLVSCGLIAQSWCPPGAVWIYDTGNPWNVSQTKFRYAGDTSIDGQQAQRLERTMQMYWQGTFIETGPANAFTRSDGDVVLDWNELEWDTLFWFSAVPGDSWQPFWSFQEQCPDHALHVVDTNTVIVDGISLRQVWVEQRYNDEPTGSPIPITERIGGGSWGHVFPGIAPCGAIYECYCTFSCYRDDEINSDDNCDLTLAIERDYKESSLLVQPNPGSNFFRLTGLGDRPAQLRMMDLQGRVVLELQNIPDQRPIDVSEFRSGIYVIEIEHEVAGRQILRWVKE